MLRLPCPALWFLLATVAFTAEGAAQGVSNVAESQIHQVEQATRSVATPAAAAAAGFAPVLGWIPTMGVHWVSDTRMLSGPRFDLTRPSQLMFSKIAGRDSLVGAAYAFLAPVSDSMRPATFDGNPPWHEHPNLAPPGQTLVMLHVWFVDSPDGTFAGHNPLLPFWALGIAPPARERFRDPSDGPRIRKAALALGELVDSLGLFPLLSEREPLHSQLAARRDSIRPLAAQLESAQRSGETRRWDDIATQLAAQWDAVRASYLDAAPTPVRRERMTHFLDEMASGAHGADGHHH